MKAFYLKLLFFCFFTQFFIYTYSQNLSNNVYLAARVTLIPITSNPERLVTYISKPSLCSFSSDWKSDYEEYLEKFYSHLILNRFGNSYIHDYTPIREGNNSIMEFKTIGDYNNFFETHKSHIIYRIDSFSINCFNGLEDSLNIKPSNKRITSNDSEKDSQNRSNYDKNTPSNNTSSRFALVKSYIQNMDLAQQMKDEANTMSVQYQFEQEYKNDLLKRAEELEKNTVHPNENRSNSLGSINHISSTQYDYQAIAESAGHVVSSLFKRDEDRIQDNRERTKEKSIKEIKKRITTAQKNNERLGEKYSIKQGKTKEGKATNFFGVYNNATSNWAIKPKYRSVVFIAKHKDTYLFKVQTKSLSNKKISLK